MAALNESLLLLDIETHPLAFLNELFGGVVNNLILALLIMFVGFIIGKFIGKFVERILAEVEFSAIVRKIIPLQFSLEAMIGSLLAYVIYFITILIVLTRLDIEKQVVNFVAAVILVVVVLSFFLGIWDTVPNVIAGIRLQRRRFMRLGGRIATGIVDGKIVEMSLTDTVVRTRKGDRIYIPNALLLKQIVTERKR
jgi:small-conductance mechanosensitive channel